MDKRSFKGFVEEVNEKDGTISVAVASDNSIDRDGEIVEPGGIDTGNFEKNPVLLYAHDYRSDPIGKVLEITKDENRMLFKPKFAVEESQRAKMYFDLVKGGYLNAFSIGFIPKEWQDRTNSDGSISRVFTKTELLEISLVPVPANPNALVSVREYAAKMAGEDKEIAEAIVKDLEGETKTVPPEAEAPAPVEPKKCKCGAVADAPESLHTPEGLACGKCLQKAWADMGVSISEIAKEVKELRDLADNGKKVQEVLKVDELLRHPEFHRGVLKAVDKALGIGLRDYNRAGGR